MKSPAFQFYPGDFLSDFNVIVMTAQEVGAYALLMCVCWKENGIANDIEELATVTRMGDAFADSWEKRIKRCFILREDGRWDHPRLQAERVKQQEFSAKMHDAALRRHKKAEPKQKVGTAKVQVGNALQSSSSSSNTTPTPSGRTRGKPAPWMGGVNAVWAKHYPDGSPPPGTANTLRPLFDKHPETEVLERFDVLLATTPAKYLNVPKFVATYGAAPDVVPLRRAAGGGQRLPPVSSDAIDWS